MLTERIAACTVLGLLCGCSSDAQPAGCHLDFGFEVDAGAGSPTAVFSPAGQAEVPVRVWVPETTVDYNCRFSEVTTLPDGDGLAVEMPHAENWPIPEESDTLIPLDYVFIGADLTVIKTIANVPPNNPYYLEASGLMKYFLEVRGNWAADHGVVPGTPVRFENVTF